MATGGAIRSEVSKHVKEPLLICILDGMVGQEHYPEKDTKNLKVNGHLYSVTMSWLFNFLFLKSSVTQKAEWQPTVLSPHVLLHGLFLPFRPQGMVEDLSCQDTPEWAGAPSLHQILLLFAFPEPISPSSPAHLAQMPSSQKEGLLLFGTGNGEFGGAQGWSRQAHLKDVATQGAQRFSSKLLFMHGHLRTPFLLHRSPGRYLLLSFQPHGTSSLISQLCKTPYEHFSHPIH